MAGTPLEGEIKIAEFAAMIGVSPRRVSQLVEQGVLDRSSPGRLVLGQSLARYFRNLREASSARQVQSGDVEIDPAFASARLSREKRLLQEFKNEAMRADLIPIGMIEKAMGNVLVFCQSRFKTLAEQAHYCVRRHGMSQRDADECRNDVLETLDRLEGDAPSVLRRARGSDLEDAE